MNRKIVIAIGGASGSIYAKLLVEKLAVLNLHDLHIDLIMTENAKINWKLEMSTFEESAIPYKIYANNDFFALSPPVPPDMTPWYSFHHQWVK